MGYNFKKKTVVCDCECQRGSNCGRKTCFMFRYGTNTDIGDLYIKDIPPNTENEDSLPYQHIRTFTDDEISAICSVMEGGQSEEEITKNDKLA
jgi:hypothetical protein